MSTSRKPIQSHHKPRKGVPQQVGDLSQDLLRRLGFDHANVAILPDRHPQVRECERHGPYQISAVDNFGVVRYMAPVCPVCATENMSRRLLGSASIPARHQHCDFDTFIVETPEQQAVLDTCRDYAEHFARYAAAGSCMVFSGSHGTGKNHLATAIARTVLGMGRSVLQVTARGLITRIRETWGSKGGEWTESGILRAIAGADLLIIDEVGKQFGGDGEEIHFFEVINYRYLQMKPTIVLSNESAQGIESYLGVAAFDRLCEGGLLLQFDWPGHRRGRVDANIGDIVP
ncbi:putative DNA replication protein DnaC [Acidithiobacillus ferrivorans]|uniref:DNA replication protein DnaC n=1 Tax=Acidithiobacillus ferrivorans TaxID=160808 RepID=A0A060UUW8_9PROT|nr:ATP-binding protein [Acidithiobacillus ferrivorans]CDQ12121.1 putative DNA replication protein DnaC [Acidithiobacillus ferrivorans]SMH64751.1 putative DNA replication protein DnaC [Acidithiobacillus ferrivorans]